MAQLDGAAGLPLFNDNKQTIVSILLVSIMSHFRLFQWFYPAEEDMYQEFRNHFDNEESGKSR